ncbi:Arabinose efflux permease [Delftia tsuruhatensis]|uniref:MFS transporter n=1 Tax=Delftia tsuruhatensis TaxID=180282 RepID=UPI001E729DA6|nr:MFS transporter [Delftia tsuruhatensis]CAB5693599.1 Arabinose efflux permease [Delftia tsuruhatensis]CAC9687415.1 Arabinose efflux permease [Delftia tsuruhatensis]
MQGRHGNARRWLPGLHFFLADVRDGMGPFLGVFLLAQGWRLDDIGYVMALGGMAGMLATTPLGALVDASRHKRRLLAVAIALLLAGNLAIWAFPSLAVTAASQVVAGLAAALVAPCLLAITLQITGHAGLPRQLGINEAWNHAGNVAAAALAGAMGFRWGLPSVFVLMALMGCAALMCLGRMRLHEAGPGTTVSCGAAALRPAPLLRVLAGTPSLAWLAAVMLLFHLGNAAMLPLLGQAAVARGHADPAGFTALTIIVAQLVMIPMALMAGRHARRKGYWALVRIALLSLPLRGLVAAAWDSDWALVPVQVLDGVGAGLLGVALPGLVAQMLRGTGHVNAGLGVVMTLQGLGAAASPALAGWIAQRFGFDAAFLSLGAIALLALVLCWCAGRPAAGRSGRQCPHAPDPARQRPATQPASWRDAGDHRP